MALLGLLLSRDGELIAGFARHDFARLAAKVAIGVAIGSLVFVLFRQRFSEALQAALFWVVLGLLLAVAYTFRGDLRELGNRVLADLIPGRAVQVGRAVEIARGRSGEFFVDMQVNDARIGMVLDTGASSVVLTPEAAKAAGLPLEVLSYSVTIETANGRARAAAVTLDRIAVGSIVERPQSARGLGSAERSPVDAGPVRRFFRTPRMSRIKRRRGERDRVPRPWRARRPALRHRRPA